MFADDVCKKTVLAPKGRSFFISVQSMPIPAPSTPVPAQDQIPDTLAETPDGGPQPNTGITRPATTASRIGG